MMQRWGAVFVLVAAAGLIGGRADRAEAVNNGVLGAGFEIKAANPDANPDPVGVSTTPEVTPAVINNTQVNFKVRLWYDDEYRVERPAQGVASQTYTIGAPSGGLISQVVADGVTYSVNPAAATYSWTTNNVNPSSVPFDVTATIRYTVASSNVEDKIVTLSGTASFANGSLPASGQAKLTVIQVNISVSSLSEQQDETPGAAVMLNDDFDSGHTALTTSTATGGYRQGEPLLDKDVRASYASEDDLLAISIDVLPHGVGGSATLAAGSSNIRLWPSASKGTSSAEILLPQSYDLSTFPKTLYVEGWAGGAASLALTYTTAGANNIIDTLNINIVSLVESQGGQRKVINKYNEAIKFEVQNGASSYEYRWDLNASGTLNEEFEAGTGDRIKNVKYGPIQSAPEGETPGSVQLVRNAANRRQKYNVSVELRAPGQTTPVLTLFRLIYVALDGFYGTALTASTTVADRQADVVSRGAAAGTFDPTPPGDATVVHSDAWFRDPTGLYGVPLEVNTNRLQYAPKQTGVNGVTRYDPSLGSSRRVFGVFVGTLPYDGPPVQTGESVTATINHENLHVAQHSAVRDARPPEITNVWRRLDDHYLNTDGYLNFREAEGSSSEVNDTNVGWYHLRGAGQNDLVGFALNDAASPGGYYNKAVDDWRAITNAATKDAARTLLKDMYSNLSPELSLKMKTYGWMYGYDYYVRPPE